MTSPSSDPRVLVRAIERAVGDAAAAGFAGAVRVERNGEVLHHSAHGLADRAHGIANTTSTRFAAASGQKSITAIVVMQMVEAGAMSLDTSIRETLGNGLPLIDPSITVGQLLTHHSGLPDYCAEIGATEPGDVAHEQPCAADTPGDILRLLARAPMRAAAGVEFRYNNAGFVLLALMAERLADTPFHELVERSVLAPAAMLDSGILCTDELPGDAAIGYVEPSGLRTNVHLVPRRGLGDGGLYTTGDDMARLWQALSTGVLLRHETFATMTTPHGWTAGGTPYGMGFWLHRRTHTVELEGCDHGISFRSVHQPSTGVSWTVASNWTDGAWPLADRLGVDLGTTIEH